MDEQKLYETLAAIREDIRECKTGIKSICVTLDRHDVKIEEAGKTANEALQSTKTHLAKVAGFGLGGGFIGTLLARFINWGG